MTMPMISNDILRECVVVYKDDNNMNRIISADAAYLLRDWWNECEYVANNDAPVSYASYYGEEVKCKTFGEYMEAIIKISKERRPKDY